MASSEENNSGAESSSALFSKFGGSIFGGNNSPQKVVTNIRGFITNRFAGAIPVPDTGEQKDIWISQLRNHGH